MKSEMNLIKCKNNKVKSLFPLSFSIIYSETSVTVPESILASTEPNDLTDLFHSVKKIPSLCLTKSVYLQTIIVCSLSVQLICTVTTISD